jgi:O-antigen/teichoic acid export membrane protein
MNIIQRVSKNILSLFAAQFFSMILSMVLSIFIARLLGDLNFGHYSFAITFITLYTIFMDLGYDTLLVRDVARDKSLVSNYVNNILSLRFLTSFVIFILMVFTINIIGYPEIVKNIVYLLGLSNILESLSNVFRTTFRAFEKMEYEAALTIILYTIRVSLGLLVLFLGYGLLVVAFVFILSSLINLLLSVIVCWIKFTRIKLTFDTDFFKHTIKIALPLAGMALFGFVFVRIDIVMLSIMKGDAVVGWYNAAYTILGGFTPIPQVFMSALFPLFSYFSISSSESLLLVYRKSFKFLFLLGLPLAIGVFLISDKIVLLFYGKNFFNTIIALQILSWDLLLKFLYLCALFVLISINKQKQILITVICTALLNIGLNIILIPNYSYIGAAIATLITEAFLLIVYLYLNHRYSYPIQINKTILSPVIACIIMGMFIFLVGNINLGLLIAGSIIIYFSFLFLFKGISKDDIALLKQLINK